MRYRGYVYRAHKPLWAWDDPLSGEGARQRGGRFNRQGTPAFYTALSLFGALREASQPLFPLQPVLICSYDVDVEPVFDATDASVLAAAGASAADLDCPDWERRMLGGKIPKSQRLAERLIAQGYRGMIAPSFAPAGMPETRELSGDTDGDDRNLVLWEWGDALPSQVRLVDDEGRLASRRRSD